MHIFVLSEAMVSTSSIRKYDFILEKKEVYNIIYTEFLNRFDNATAREAWSLPTSTWLSVTPGYKRL